MQNRISAVYNKLLEIKNLMYELLNKEQIKNLFKKKAALTALNKLNNSLINNSEAFSKDERKKNKSWNINKKINKSEKIKNNNFRLKCSFCNKEQHVKSDCWKKYSNKNLFKDNKSDTLIKEFKKSKDSAEN